ncbi:RidA family protein [Spirosoma validum]|uniref:RidA family protein n=1 Tax=Spirosoma validum TaxID=2771355 RepID=A0A927AZJ2_9BACT|nr:RidA family protein [Spirosoma validum]MBD2752668.1 RidA family protein [Spirosoma validum]
MKAPRRSLLKRFFSPITRITDSSHNMQESSQDVPLYSGITRQGNLLFVQGIGAHFEGDARAHADHILTEMEKMLVKVGSSMQKVLKVNVYLHDINDYKAMNEVYKGRFGPKPPVRTTVSPRAGIPNGSLVEMDCIAYI